MGSGRTSRRSHRRRVALAGGALVAGTLPVVALAAPAAADPGCTTEVAPRVPLLGTPTGPHCDDTMAPETTLIGTQPAVSDLGWINSSSIKFEFAGQQPATDAGDTDPITFECRSYPGTTPPALGSWRSCTSGEELKDLVQSSTNGGQPYTFEVRAVDSVDHATDTNARFVPHPDIGLPVVFNPFPVPDTPDYDETPERVTFSVDTVAPQESRIIGKPQDPVNPRWPMVTQPRLDLELRVQQDTGSPVGVECDLDEVPVPCQPGAFTLTGLKPGDHIFRVGAIDAAGNRESYPDRVFFSVPRNLKARGPWRTRTDETAFAGDYLETRKVGAQVKAKVKDVREVRLIAPSGPKQGRVEVYLGKRLLRTFSLYSQQEIPARSFVVRPRTSPRTSRPITVKVVRVPKGGAVRLDALLVH